MAFSITSNGPSFASVSSAATYTVNGWFSSGAYNPLPGDLVVCVFTGNHTTGTTATASDNSAEPGTANVWTVLGPAEGSTFCSAWMVWCVLTRGLVNSSTVTLTASTSASRRTGVARVVVASVGPITFDTSAIANNDNASPIGMTTPVLATTGDVVIAGGGVRAGAGATVTESGSGFALSGQQTSGGSGTVMTVGLSRRLAAGTAAVTASQGFTALSTGAGIIAAWKEAGGTLYTQGVSGALSFSGGAPKKASQRALPAVLSFSGAEVAHPTARRVTGSFAPTGSLTQQLSLFRTLTAAFQPTGSLGSAAARLRTLVGAVFTPTGAISTVKAVSKAVSGALSFSGSQTHRPNKNLAAGFTPVGSLNRTMSLGRTITAIFGPTGALSKLTNRRLPAASAGFVGHVITSAKTSQFFASLSFSGSVSNGLPARTFYAGLSFTGNVSRFTARQLVASLIASGVLHTHYLPPVTPPFPGGGGYGALMSDSHFQRYKVAGAWSRVKRVKP